ncbi:MAG: pilus assembly protein PilP, partial [Deltaproteobacteria bacterium]|nr:pilus assembly protein PilP [Deltaproteobacteria bacterium]
AAPPPGAPPAEGVAAEVDARRDPFRPFTLSLNGDAEDPNAPLSPLQRYELPQLRLAAVVLESSPPRAMLQDNSGMGFIVTPGTPIGRRHGVVKSIEPRRIVVEELVLDYYGRQQAHQVVIEMPKDDKKDDKAEKQ